MKIVGIESPYGDEGVIRKELRRRLALLGAREITYDDDGAQAPLNLIMEFPATADFADRQAVILNAHMDTIKKDMGYAPEEMDFDAKSGEFFHRQGGSFGADDKAGIAVILGALEAVKSRYWDQGIGHRRIIVVMTAQEECGYLGAQYLAERHPQLFDNVEIALTCDGPLNYEVSPLTTESSFVVVVDEETSFAPPYRKIVECVQDVCARKNVSFMKSSVGLGHGDSAFFPSCAHTDLHIRSPYQNNHRNEKVRLVDLFNHIDLFTYILLRMDGIDVKPVSGEATVPASSPVVLHNSLAQSVFHDLRGPLPGLPAGWVKP